MTENSRKQTCDDIADSLQKIRSDHPLIHNITNYVVMNFTANALLALGASPVMAHAPEEVEEMTGLASALVINIGTLSSPWVASMRKALEAARKRQIPIVLDPVGAGATKFRTDTALSFLERATVTVLRGNASEILALAGESGKTKGVDSARTTSEARLSAAKLAARYGITVAVTGAVDFITDGAREAEIANGHPLMGRITGTGCSASAITGAFCAAAPDAFRAAAGALVVFGIAGEIAGQSAPGPGTFQPLLLDALYTLGEEAIRNRTRLRLS
ncbi:MAG: hydroxyethylthiazole kinase [Desulfobacteraceae bacterium]|nr:hydroxyethylthiazole kinase [Desulfobacteraceae bacterium]